MATLTPTLTLASTTIFADQPLNMTVSLNSTVQAPMTDINKMSTGDNLGLGAGIIISENDTNNYFVYLKHTGLLATDGVSTCNASADFVLVGNPDADGGSKVIKLQPGEFAFFPTAEGAADDTVSAGEVGGLKLYAGSAAVQIEYAYWKRS